MNTRTISLLLVLALAGCDDDGSSMMPGTDSGPPAPGTDAGPGGGGTDAGPGGGGADAGPGGGGGLLDGCPATLPEVAVRFDGCETLSACGGDPTGTWVYDDVCVEVPTPDLSGVCPAARVEELEGTARGCVALDGDEVARNVSGDLSWTVVVPESCTFGMGCAAIEAALGSSCTVDGGDCRCPMSDTFGSSTTDSYTIAGSVLTTGDGSQYDFCVDGGELSYVERGGDAADEPGINVLR